MTKKSREYGEFLWSWFYKHFIKNTVNDNFYTPEEIMKNQKEIINRVRKKNLNYNNNKNQC